MRNTPKVFYRDALQEAVHMEEVNMEENNQLEQALATLHQFVLNLAEACLLSRLP